MTHTSDCAVNDHQKNILSSSSSSSRTYGAFLLLRTKKCVTIFFLKTIFYWTPLLLYESHSTWSTEEMTEESDENPFENKWRLLEEFNGYSKE